uniref:Cytochrome c oxidase subunit 3 n=1 Tax=Macrocheles muscaedomesticae TaxID=406086 RepID=A0A6B9WFQ7_9ACAR|nr:cytochrome c oxidase subunit III [Macrocheles muscaedomesticae]QHQ98527.1 cytochrome oxidase subunit 3 [Macrocheles muscaedomesticae]
MTFHPFHMVERSPWPLTGAMSALFMTSGSMLMIYNINNILLYSGLILLSLTSYQWWRDIMRESTFQGQHTLKVMKGLKMGMMLFILSEVFFFISFFWTYFHGMLSPDTEIGLLWPPQGITPFNPFTIPLLNTIILLSSGVSITWTHHSIINMNYKNAVWSLLLTFMLGIYFTVLQLFEYYSSPFSISDGLFGSIFFLSTGFHGLHVIIGTTFLIINFFRLLNSHFSNLHHFSFEASAWYWHFVDVVWLFLYTFIYWWIY